MNRDPRCDGCLGSRRCWVCLGLGVVDRRHGGVDACPRCFGSGKCTYCQPVNLVDLGSAFGLVAEAETENMAEDPPASAGTVA